MYEGWNEVKLPRRRLLTAVAGCALLALPACAAQASPLEGTSWKLDLPEEQTNAGLIPVEVTLTFVTEDSVEGRYGPQKYAGSYAVDGERITFEALCWTTMACMAAGGTMNAEQEYLFALEDAQTFSLDGDTLTISYGDRALTFHRK
jgi:heat shock protein HslJ